MEKPIKYQYYKIEYEESEAPSLSIYPGGVEVHFGVLHQAQEKAQELYPGKEQEEKQDAFKAGVEWALHLKIELPDA